MAENLDIVVTERGAREVQRSIEGIGAAAVRASAPMRQLQLLLASYVSLQGLRNLTRLTDQFTELENRIRVLDGISGDYSSTLRRIYDISQETRSSIRDNVQLFQRLGLAQKELNASSEELFQVTRAVGQAIAIQGGLATTSAGAVLQLSQAFGSGRVQLEEFNSVITGLYPVAKAAADGIDAAGGSIAKLRRMIADGEVDSRMLFQGILKSVSSLDEQFAKTTPTISQAFTIFRNALLMTVGDFNNATGASESLARALIGLSGNLDNVVLGFTVLAAAGLPAAIGYITVEIVKLTRAMKALMLSNPITALLSLATGALAYFVLFNEELDKIDAKTGQFVSAIDRIGAAWVGSLAYIKAAWADFPRWFTSLILDAVNSAIEAIKSFGTQLGEALDSGMTSLLKGEFTFKLPDPWTGATPTDPTAAFKKAYDEYLQGALQRRSSDAGDPNARPGGSGSTEVTTKGIERLQKSLESLIGSIDPVAGAWLKWGEAQKTVEQALDAGLITLDQYNQLLGQAYRHFETSLSPLGEFNREMEQQSELLQLNTAARERQLQIYSIEEQLSRKLTDTEKAAVVTTMTRVQQLSALREVIDELEEPQANFIRKVTALNTAFDQGYLSQDQYVRSLRDVRLELLQTRTDVEAGFERGILTIGKEFTDTSILIETSLVNAFKSAEDAFVQFVKTGKISFADLADSIIEDLIRIAVQQSITGPIANIMGSMFGGLFGATSAVSQVGSIGSGMSASAWMPSRAIGGHTPPNSLMRINETGLPEVWSNGSEDYLMTGSSSGTVHPLSDSGSAGIVLVQPKINIINNSGASVETRQRRGSDGQPEIDVLISQAERTMASNIQSGQSPLVGAISNKFGVTPQAGGR